MISALQPRVPRVRPSVHAGVDHLVDEVGAGVTSEVAGEEEVVDILPCGDGSVHPLVVRGVKETDMVVDDDALARLVALFTLGIFGVAHEATIQFDNCPLA